MKKSSAVPYVFGGVTALLFLGVVLFVFCPAIHVQNPGLWVLTALTVFIFLLATHLMQGYRHFIRSDPRQKSSRDASNPFWRPTSRERLASYKLYLIPLGILLIMGLLSLIGSPAFNATAYADILTVTESDFASDLSESVGTDSIALMDTASAQMLGDREIGSLSDVVSQYDVSWDYTQIDRGGKPIKVAALDYAGFFKWFNNRSVGVGGYVTVDPVSMSGSFHRCAGMKYVPSAYLMEDAYRHLWVQYPTLMMDNLHFEIDEEGKPYYVASVMEKRIGLFGGRTVSGCIVMDPVTGDTTRYDVADIPRWVDVVFHGNLICEQYNWHGLYQNGFWNSLFAKKGCKQVTTYTVSDMVEEEDTEDDAPVSDYGYVAKDGDIWIYTGITSVNGDSSNIGFLLANERTGESRFYPIAGADEKSAMHAAEGEVQEKGYQASFPSLINVESEPTYIMVLKDAGGLVKLYAAVNVEQYNLVATAATLEECLNDYKALIGEEADPLPDPTETTVTFDITAIEHIVIDGNTYIYLFGDGGNLYRAKAADHEEMLMLQVGDNVTLTVIGKEIQTCAKAE